MLKRMTSISKNSYLFALLFTYFQRFINLYNKYTIKSVLNASSYICPNLYPFELFNFNVRRRIFSNKIQDKFFNVQAPLDLNYDFRNNGYFRVSSSFLIMEKSGKCYSTVHTGFIPCFANGSKSIYGSKLSLYKFVLSI